jgi:putative transposase
MPRGPRLDAPGVLHHVMVRGIERSAIFVDDIDRGDFIARLERLCADGGAVVYAWCLMDNHVHLAIRTGARPLATTMRRLLTGYAVSFNRRHGRAGHLFQNRYKSIVIDEERYLLALVRYIHRNPVRAGLVESVDALAEHPWSGHAALVGATARGFQEVDAVLSRFGARVGVARRALRDFMGAAQASAEERVFEGGGLRRSMGVRTRSVSGRRSAGEAPRMAYDERILGSGSFVEAVLERAVENARTDAASSAPKEERFARLIGEVAEKLGLEEDELKAGGRRRDVVSGREVVAFFARARLGMPATKIAAGLGGSQPAIVKAAERGRRQLEGLPWEPSLK